MGDQNQDPTNPNPNPNPPPSDKPNDVKALEAKAKELVEELRKLKGQNKDLSAKASEADALKAKLEKVTALAKELGVPIDTTDPDAERKRREADKLAQDARNGRIRDAVTMGLIESGRKVPRQVASAIISGALAEPTISVDDEGKILGADEYLATWLNAIGGPSEGGRPTAPQPPARGGAGSGGGGTELPAKFKNVNTLLDFQGLPMADQLEFHKSFPDVYAAISAKTRSGLAHPIPPPPPSFVQPNAKRA